MEIDISRDGTLIFSACKDSLGRIWDASGNLKTTLEGHKSSVSSIDFDENSKTIITGGYGNHAIVWNSSGEILGRLIGHENSVVNVFNCSKYFVTASRDNTAIAWSKKEREKLFQLKGHTAQINFVIFNDRLQKFVSGSIDGTLRMWNEKGEQVKVISSFESDVRSIAISKSANMILVGLENGQVTMLDFEGTKIREVQAHNSRVTAIEIFDDAFFTSGVDGFIKKWTFHGEPLYAFKGHESYITKLLSNHDNLISCGGDKHVKIWSKK